MDANILVDSFYKCSKNSKWKESTQRYEMNLLRNTLRLKKEIENRTYKQKPFYTFTLCERGKMRPIRSMHVSDRVVQRAYCDNVLIPAIRPKLIYDNGASLKGKGTNHARHRLDTHLRRHIDRYGDDGYILLMDFSKFFDNIPHDKLKEKLASVLPDMWPASDMIDSFAIDLSYLSDAEFAACEKHYDALEHPPGEGGKKILRKSVGIGSQISQACGIFYPSEIDVYCTAVRGHRGYGRYMDDIYVIDIDKARLWETYREVCTRARALGLKINERKSGVVKLTHGFTFLQVKYRVKDGKIEKHLKQNRVIRERRRLKKFRGMLDDGRMTYKAIENSYKSWRGDAVRMHARLDGIDQLYNVLFMEDEAWSGGRKLKSA